MGLPYFGLRKYFGPESYSVRGGREKIQGAEWNNIRSEAYSKVNEEWVVTN